VGDDEVDDDDVVVVTKVFLRASATSLVGGDDDGVAESDVCSNANACRASMDALRASATIASTLLVRLCLLLLVNGTVGGGGNGDVRVGIVSADEEEMEGRMTADGCGQVPSLSLRDVMG
jgi:hypothetical protein